MTQPELERAYADAVAGDWRDGAVRSARRVVPLVAELLRPTSVVDIGCGVGAWLSVFAAHGITDYMGVDGSYIRKQDLLIPPSRFIQADLRQGFSIGRRFDLAVSLEVGEHLPAATADRFVHDLVALAPAVLFSAAVPGQGGLGHVNEQWPSYWGRLFAGHGYLPADLVRTAVWDDQEVEVWYRQNLLVYLDPDTYARVGDGRPEEALRAIIHPDLARPTPQILNLRAIASELPGAVRRFFRYHVRRRRSH